MSELNTNFNVAPYFDDFSEDLDYYRILFRPRVPIQARELTQLQTNTQKQIQRFGDHVFKDGSVVDGCHVTYYPGIDYVSLENFFDTDNTLSVTSVTSTHVLVGETSGVRAICMVAKEGFEATFPNTNRFYVRYIRSGDSSSKFIQGEYIRVYSPNQDSLGILNEANFVDRIKIQNISSFTGNGYAVSVSDGIIYHKGFFLRVATQTILVREFDNDPSGYRVGFDTTEFIYTEDQDSTLNDNALGYPNYNAPGAHRLKLIPVLITKTREEAALNKNFFAVVEFDDVFPTEQHTDPAYDALGDELAKRTYEESGDYVVKPFTIETFPGVNANTNLTDANLFSYAVSTGIAYVKGNRIEKIGSSRVTTDRAYTEDTSEAQIVTMNYGNYAIVNELMGQFDDNSPEVTIYDAAQTTLTDLEKASGARAGNIVGYANLRSLVFYSGTKGIPSCQFLAYLDNIRMNSGKSFSLHAKSFYASGSHGAARADIVQTTNRYANGSLYYQSTLNDANRKTLVFNIGPSAVKSLTDNSGASDTQFVFNDTANATLQSNSYISVSLNAPSAGGSERVNASGTLTTLGEKIKFDVVLKNDVLTANLTGTVSVNTVTANVVGTGTSFSTQFQAGEYIRVTHQGGDQYKRVVTVTNTTHMVVASAFSAINASATFGKLYPEGLHVDLSSTSANVVVTSNTTFAINSYLGLGGNLTGTANVAVTYPVLKYNSYPMRKNVNKSVYVKIDCSNNAATSKGPWVLGIPDVYDLEAVYYGTTYDVNNTDAIDWFTLDTGQRDSYYDLAKLEVKPQYSSKITGSSKLLVKLSHFTANSSPGVGYFCVDSYPTSNTSNTTTITWGEIPTFTSQDSTTYDLRNCVDVRPFVANTAVSATAVGSATINPAVAVVNTYVSSTVGFTPLPDSNFQTDVAYYLPRRDLVVVNRAGDFSVIKGEPAEFPRTPTADNDVMVVANTYVPAWPSLTQREAVSYGRPDLKIKHTTVTNRRYTMRDIGVLENRIKRLEYYTVLNAVEQKARDFTITDVNGLDRFKNGIFADPFNNHALGKVSDFEYKVAIDSRNSLARPYFATHTVDLKYNTSTSTTQKTSHTITVPYTNEEYVVQRFGSKFRNCSESIWQWNGKLSLYPAFDDNVDKTAVPNNNVTLDLAQAWEDFAASPFGTEYGAWTTKSRSSTSSTSSTSSSSTTRSTTRTTQEQIVEKLHVDTTTETYDLGTYVKDVTNEPYIESRQVGFIATNMKPNTVVHAFFDDENVDAHCAPADIDPSVTQPQAGREDKYLMRTGSWGATLKTDSSGTVRGLFTIPPETFRVGDRVFSLVDVADLVTGISGITTQADARFSASNMTISTQGITLTTVEPELNVVASKNTKVVVTTTTSTTSKPSKAPAAMTPEQAKLADQQRAAMNRKDPIAQSVISVAPDGVSGIFATKLDLYFQAKDPTLGVTVLFVEMRNGSPDTTRVIGRSYKTSAEVSVSDDSSAVTTFVFENPVFLATDQWYAFLVKPDGDSPEYRIWLGETGGYDTITGEQIYQNPYSGVTFVSSNMNTWSPIQKEDIKFILYRANFSTGSYVAYFNNEPDEFITFSGLIRANTGLYVQVGDLAYTVNSANISQVFTGANTTQPYGVVQYVDEPSEKVYLDVSTTGWAAGQVIQFHRPTAVGNTALINVSTRIATANVVSIDDLDYHAAVPRFATIVPARTSITMAFKGVQKTGNVIDADWWSTVNDEETEFLDTTRIAKSRTNEVAAISGNTSVNYALTLSTETNYLSPVVDLRRKSTLLIENLINNDSTGEANTRYGSASTKYVSRNVILDDGQEAEDFSVIVSAYKPSGTDIKVYVKLHNQEDPQSFDDKVWTELSATDNGSTFSSPIDRKDYTDFVFGIPSSAPATNPRAAYLGTDGIVTYTSSDGSVYYGYKTFCIKIVMLSSNPARVPLCNDVRAIALQV